MPASESLQFTQVQMTGDFKSAPLEYVGGAPPGRRFRGAVSHRERSDGNCSPDEPGLERREGTTYWGSR